MRSQYSVHFDTTVPVPLRREAHSGGSLFQTAPYEKPQ